MKNKHDEGKLEQGSVNGHSESWEKGTAIETNVLCYVARGRGLMVVGDSAKAARLALEQKISEWSASAAMKERLTVQPEQEVVMTGPMSTVGYVFGGDTEHYEVS